MVLRLQPPALFSDIQTPRSTKASSQGCGCPFRGTATSNRKGHTVLGSLTAMSTQSSSSLSWPPRASPAESSAPAAESSCFCSRTCVRERTKGNPREVTPLPPVPISPCPLPVGDCANGYPTNPIPGPARPLKWSLQPNQLEPERGLMAKMAVAQLIMPLPFHLPYN